jgi:hypothetical protein
MKRLGIGVAVLAVGLTPALLVAQQRGPEPQQGTGQNNPDMEHGTTPIGKSEQPRGSDTAPQSTGQESPDTQQTKHKKKKKKVKKNHKDHGGSHDQASPQS